MVRCSANKCAKECELTSYTARIACAQATPCAVEPHPLFDREPVEELQCHRECDVGWIGCLGALEGSAEGRVRDEVCSGVHLRRPGNPRQEDTVPR